MVIFLSTPSARRATIPAITGPTFTSHFYPRPPRGGRRYIQSRVGHSSTISIHALREEGDQLFQRLLYPSFRISIHALREEGDGLCMVIDDEGLLFLSTPSARRATVSSGRRIGSAVNFYPRPPRGGRRGFNPELLLVADFYPRPPRGGRQQKQRQNLYFLINYTTFCTNLEEP